jgi:superfamily II DNA or RNA helicase
MLDNSPLFRTIATYQTLLQPSRIAKFDPSFLKAIIVDEAHHAAAPSCVFGCVPLDDLR